MITDNWNEHKWQEFGKKFVREHVLLGQAVLICDLVALSSESDSELAQEFSLDEADNFHAPNGLDDWGAERCITWLRANNVDEEEWPDDWSDWNEMEEDERDNIWDNDIDGFSEDDDWQVCVRDHWEEPEIYEWYVVSDWFEIRLREIGEVILSNSYGSWWGRGCTGQFVYMDEYLRPIFSEWVERWGDYE